MRPLNADAACNTSLKRMKKILSDCSPSSQTSYSFSDVSDNDCTSDFIPSTSDEDDDGDIDRLSLHCTQKRIMQDSVNYIGLHEDHLYILDLLATHIPYSSRVTALTRKDCVLMVLMIIRTGMACYIVADMFGVSKSWVSRTFARCVPVMASCLKGLVRWPPSEVIKQRLPNSFKAYYNNVETIIDCFEIEIEKPSSAMSQSMTWSDYKKCNTVKYLISCTPSGLINFISSGRPGRCSDMELLKESGYLDHLKPGTTVLSDRGFKEVEGHLVARGCHLIRPKSVAKDEHLTAKNVFQMKTIAGLRIHIERVIRRVRVFKFLEMHSGIRLSMVDLLDDIVQMVCGLVNLQPRIVKV